ncbi:MAG: RHS repeat-associated core domain-containing protein [Bacteroidota bacterium]|nr:RHS repeat-associated core domain-containing protein [Bacteroidota bacterium]
MSTVSNQSRKFHTGYVETYRYDSNDLAPLTNATGSNVPSTDYYTPKSSEVDALGRTIKTTEFFDNSNYANTIEMNYRYDIRGNLLLVKDPYNRDVFEHWYDLRAPQKDQPLPPLKTIHIDKGESTILLDAPGKPIESIDAKGAIGLRAYDVLSRPTHNWAKNKTADAITLRSYLIYGETATTPSVFNLNGKAYQSYDEAGFVETPEFDFKGNLFTKSRQVISTTTLKSALGSYTTFIVDWTGLPSILDTFVYETSMEYDALNRITKLTLPEDLDTERKSIIPTYNTAGALEKVDLYSPAGPTTTNYVENIAYNAKGQRLLLAFGNGIMTRYAYDPITFRLLRQRSEKFTKSTVGSTITYAYNAGTNKQDDGFNFDLVGNIVKILNRVTDCGINGTTLGDDALDREFEYDSIYRLTYADGREADTQSGAGNYIYDDAPDPGSPNATNVRAYSRTYTYDKLGNVQSVIQAGTNGFTRDFTYNTGKNTLQKVEDATPTLIESYTYDANGNQLSSSLSRHYAWNHADQLICYKNQVGAGTPTVYTQYDYAGQDRVSKLVRTGSTYERTIYIDGIFEYVNLDNGSTYEKNYIHIMDDKSRIAEVRINPGTAFPGDITEDLVYTLEDQIGSSVVRIKTTGTVIDKEEYYPFGDSSLRTFTYKRYRYVGKERDAESGLYYYGARYYAAWTCRFISVDPLAGKYVFQSAYVHADNDPINKIDHNGEGTEEGGDKGNNNQNSGGDSSTKETPKPEVHNVKKGETLSGIAKQHGTTVEKLRGANNLEAKNDKKLQIGKKLDLPEQKEQQRAEFEKIEVDPINHNLDSLLGKADTGNGQKTQATNLAEVLGASMLKYSQVEIKGNLLNQMKNDPEMNKELLNFYSEAKAYFNEKDNPSYLYSGVRGVRFGPSGAISSESELFWAVGHANVKMWAEKDNEGKINLEIRVMDRLDLGPSVGNRSLKYNVLTLIGGSYYHGAMGGNRAMITTAKWNLKQK